MQWIFPRGGVSCDGGGTEMVDGGLHDHRAEADGGLHEPHGKTGEQKLCGQSGIQTEIAAADMQKRTAAQDIDQTGGRGDHL